jgi:hypothetical protein
MDQLLSPVVETAFRAITWFVFIFAVINILWPFLPWKIIRTNWQQVPRKIKDRRVGSIGQFVVKTLIVSAAAIGSAWIMLDVLDDFADRRMQQFERTLRSAISLGGRQFWTKLENQLEQLADPKSDLSPEKKQKLLKEIQIISDRWRPLILEAVSGVNEPPPALRSSPSP